MVISPLVMCDWRDRGVGLDTARGTFNWSHQCPSPLSSARPSLESIASQPVQSSHPLICSLKQPTASQLTAQVNARQVGPKPLIVQCSCRSYSWLYISKFYILREKSKIAMGIFWHWRIFIRGFKGKSQICVVKVWKIWKWNIMEGHRIRRS